MKRAIVIVAAIGLLCGLTSGCAIFGSHQGKGSSKTPGDQANAASQGGFPETTAGTNQVTTTTTSQGPVTTTVSGGKVTTVANGGAGGTGPGPGEVGGGAGAATAGHGPLFYFYLLFAAALVIWVIWAIWHSYHRRRRPARVRYRRRPRPA